MLTMHDSAGGTKMSVWDSAPPRPPLRASTSVREQYSEARPFVHDFSGGLPSEALAGEGRTESGKSDSEHTSVRKFADPTTTPNRQEVSLHRSRLHPWSYPDWHRCVHQDAPDHHYPPRIPPLHPQVRPLREATQEPCRPRLPSLPCRGG